MHFEQSLFLFFRNSVCVCVCVLHLSHEVRGGGEEEEAEKMREGVR